MGTLISGKLKINDEVEIRPGILTKGKNGKYTHEPIITNLLSFETNNNNLEQLSIVDFSNLPQLEIGKHLNKLPDQFISKYNSQPVYMNFLNQVSKK